MDLLLVGDFGGSAYTGISLETATFQLIRRNMITFVQKGIQDIPDILLVRCEPQEQLNLLQALEAFRINANSANTSVAVLCTKSDDDFERQLAALEVDLVLSEPLTTMEVQIIIQLLVRFRRQQDHIQQLNTELFETSITDSLTRVLSRSGFMLRFEVQWRLCLRDQKALSLIVIDIDHFKGYNDYYGHIEADQCLIRIAQEILDTLEGRLHFVGRQGGEEFLLLLPDVSSEEAAKVAQQVRVAVQELRLEHRVSPTGGYVTVSMGLSSCFPYEASMENLRHSAERALRQAKASGRNQVCFQETLKKSDNVFYLDNSKP